MRCRAASPLAAAARARTGGQHHAAAVVRGLNVVGGVVKPIGSELDAIQHADRHKPGVLWGAQAGRHVRGGQAAVAACVQRRARRLWVGCLPSTPPTLFQLTRPSTASPPLMMEGLASSSRLACISFLHGARWGAAGSWHCTPHSEASRAAPAGRQQRFRVAVVQQRGLGAERQQAERQGERCGARHRFELGGGARRATYHPASSELGPHDAAGLHLARAANGQRAATQTGSKGGAALAACRAQCSAAGPQHT